MTVSKRSAPSFIAAAALFLVAACGGSTAQSPAKTPILASPSAPATAAPASIAGCTAEQAVGKTVTDEAELKQALAAASPGSAIVIAPGTYSGHFVAASSGTSSAPISLCGSRDAVLDGGSIKSGYTLYLNGASWWRLVGFTVQGGQKGIVTDHANHVIISGLYVHDIGDEGIHLRSFSSDNTVAGVTVRRTGLLRTKFGEGIYIGTANSNWCKYTACSPDASDRNVIRNNDIAETTAENIDIKEGTTGGVVADNHLAGDGMVASAATAWVNVKGNGWTISGNVGQHSLKDGFQVHRVYAGWGQRNIFRLNHATVDGPGYGFYVQSTSLATVLACDNTASGAAAGLSNTPCANV
jgi:hypothetical protein